MDIRRAIALIEATSPVNAPTPSKYFHVLSKDGRARVVNEDDPLLIDLWHDGWETQWDSARSVDQGLEWAKQNKQLKPWREKAANTPFEPSSYWFVLSKNGLARVVNEEDPNLLHLRDNDWEIEYDSARSVEQGLAWARDARGLLPWDSFEPRVMPEAKTLYRSVSIPELLDIARTSKIMGGGNTFNEFDPRRYVFFGDKISDELIFQGADTERQAQRLLSDHAIHGQFAKLNTKLLSAREKVAQAVREWNWEVNQRREDAGIPPIGLDETLLSNFVKGYTGKDSEIVALLPSNQRDVLFKPWIAYKKLRDQLSPLQAKYREIFNSTHRAHAGRVEAQAVTSAIVETRPLDGGLEYSLAAGSRVGMDLPEYGFPRGAVTLDDLVRVYYVKGRNIIEQGSPSEILATLGHFALA